MEVVAGGGVGQAIDAAEDRVVVIQHAPSSSLPSQVLDIPPIYGLACKGDPRARQGAG